MAVLAKESEEKLMANPDIQLMMQKFFDEKFKDMTNSGEKIVNKVRVVEKEVNNSNMIKSPSDMTIYAPALNSTTSHRVKSLNEY